MATFPNKATLPTPGMNKPARPFLLNISLAILLLLTILSLAGGHAIHIVAGTLMLIGCSVHLALHGRWIKTVILETPKDITPVLRRQRRLFWGMFLSGSLCGLSGLAMLPLILDFHAFLALHCCGTPIHIVSGLIFCGLSIHHLVLHRNWLTARLGRVHPAARR
jgi:hypothetical protein